MYPAKLMIARFPQGRSDDPDVVDFVVSTVIKAKEDPRVREDITPFWVDDTPITMSRNLCLKKARETGCDMVLMVDSDMAPDCHLPGRENGMIEDPLAKPFWDTSFDFLWKLREEGKHGVVAAPYCGPPPHENIYVFHWGDRQTVLPADETTHMLMQYSRNEASKMRGITEVAALPTGLILIDLEVCDKIDIPGHPMFYYEWTDDAQTEKASTEDVAWTRDLALAGVPIYCNWDAWAGHWKRKCVGKPAPLTSRVVGGKLRDAFRRDLNIGQNEELRTFSVPAGRPSNGQATHSEEEEGRLSREAR